jgi:hypothetical protein
MARPISAAVDDQEFGPAQCAPDEIVENRPPGLRRLATPATLSNTFWPFSRTPSTTRGEIDIAFRSCHARTAVPLRIRRTIGSSAL